MAHMRGTVDLRVSDNNLSKRDIPSFIEPLPPLISNPYMRPKPVKGTNLLELFEEDSECEDHELLQVYLRIKPCDEPSNLYDVRSEKCLVTSTDTATAGHGRRTQHCVNKMYTFSRIFGPEATQKEIFESVVKDNLRKLPDGHNYTLLTYGASGSGKTFTLMGTVASPGLVPRSLEYLFKIVDAAQRPLFKPSEGGAEKLNAAEQEYELQWVKKLRLASAPLRDKYRRMSTQLHSDFSASTYSLANRTQHYIWVSFVEIYNEAVYDLLATSDRQASIKLRIREDATGNVFVKDATQAFVRSGSEAYDALVAGKLRRQVAATGVHQHSSRSHCIFTITLLTTDEGSSSGSARTSSLRLCDLAGAERAARTHNTGARLHESRAINSSLHALERALRVLRRKQRGGTHLVPTRESKLTRLLGAGLSGRGGEAVSMVVTINPSAVDAQETKHVLQLAAVAKDIQVNSTIAESTFESIQDTTVAVGAELMKLRADNERLHYELVQSQSRNRELLLSMEERQRESASTMRELVEEAKDFTRQYYEQQIAALEERHRNEIEELTEEYEIKLQGVESSSRDVGTPSRSLQVTVTRLQTEIAILEEKLNAEKLARSRAEQEVQHLRGCIEERDEKCSEDSEVHKTSDVVMLSDGEQETDDEMNQSLEPSFRKAEKIKTADGDVGPSDNEDYDDAETTLNDAANNKFTDETYEAEKTKENLNVSSETAHNTYSNDGDGTSSNFADVSFVSTNIEVNESKNTNESKPDFKRGTFIVNQNDRMISTDSNCNISNTESRTSLTKENEEAINVSFEGKNVGKVSKALLSKIKLSTVNTNKKRKESLALFEQFEKEIKTQDKAFTRQYSEDLIKINVLKEQKTYFGSIDKIKEVTEESVTHETKPAKSYFDDENVLDMQENVMVNDEIVLKRSYFDDQVADVVNDDKLMTGKDISEIKGNELKNSRINDIITNSKEFGEIKILKEKRTYFDNISQNIEAINIKVNETERASIKFDDLRSPSIVKDDIPKDYEPTTIKKLLGDSRTSNVASSMKHNVMKTVHESLDIFDEIISPKREVVESETDDVNALQKSLKKISLIQEINRNDVIAKEVKESEDKFKIPETTQTKEVTQSISTNIFNSTDIEFENLLNDVTTANTTDFDLLLTQEINNTDLLSHHNFNRDNSLKDSKTNENSVSSVKPETLDNKDSSTTKKDNKIDSILAHAKENISKPLSLEDDGKTVKYNLRHKTNTCDDKETGNLPTTDLKAKRSLRLKRRKNQELDDYDDDRNNEKLKDIANLQREYADVMTDAPVQAKIVKDIPTPEKMNGEEENLNPVTGIQSCPSKSVTRSRRKLFTPRAEPLEESLDQTGDSHERIYVPRPSYHRGRVRRKL